MDNPKIKEIIDKIKESRGILENTSIKDLIEASTAFDVIPYSEKYRELLSEIVLIGNKIKSKFGSTPITRQLFQKYKGKKVNAFRNNEVGDFCEVLIKEAFDNNREQFKEIRNVLQLGGKGYPDLKIITNSETAFLEVKATSRPDKGSARDFYYSPGAASERKIDCSALHILIGFVTEQISNGFLIKDFKLVDVSKIKVNLKPEFNTDNLGIYNSETIIKI